MAVIICILVGCVRAADDSDIDQKLDEIIKEQGITDQNQASALKAKLKGMAKLKEALMLIEIKTPCEDDLATYCSHVSSDSEILTCMKQRMDEVTSTCKKALANQFGSQPTTKLELYNGVEIPIGSTYFYDSRGQVLGARISEDLEYRGIHFKKGTIRFHKIGLSVATLTEDQFINDVKYRADGIGPFFHSDGSIANATLVDDTIFDGIKFMGGPTTQIQFYIGGQVKSGTLASDTTIDGELFKAGTLLYFYEDGSVKIVDGEFRNK